jgi:cobaltochelatase CobN
MHLLAATRVRLMTVKPVDLGQTPADVVVISAADTELAACLQHGEMAGADTAAWPA